MFVKFPQLLLFRKHTDYFGDLNLIHIFIAYIDPVRRAIISCHYRDYRVLHVADSYKAFYSQPGIILLRTIYNE